jgi:hypothetical protein
MRILTLVLTTQPSPAKGTKLNPDAGAASDALDMTNGDWPVVAAVGGAQSPTGLVPTVQN